MQSAAQGSRCRCRDNTIKCHPAVRRWMTDGHRDLNNYQMRMVSNALGRCSLPIFVKLVFAEICRWKSYSRPQDTHLASNVMDSIMMLFEKIEKQVCLAAHMTFFTGSVLL